LDTEHLHAFLLHTYSAVLFSLNIFDIHFAEVDEGEKSYSTNEMLGIRSMFVLGVRKTINGMYMFVVSEHFSLT
jgi:hypothetical protein